MNPIGSVFLAGALQDERRRAFERGYPASADTARRAHSAERRWGIRAAVLAAVGVAGLAIEPVIGTAAVLAAIGAGLVWAVQADRRRESVDRMVELGAFAPNGAAADELAVRRQTELASTRYRQMLAARIRDAIDACTSVHRFGSPGARALAAEPELAERVAGRTRPSRGRAAAAGGRPAAHRGRRSTPVRSTRCAGWSPELRDRGGAARTSARARGDRVGDAARSPAR